MLRQDLLGCSDKMDGNYSLGCFGELEVVENKFNRKIYGVLIQQGLYRISGRSQEEFENEVVKYISNKKIKSPEKEGELEEITLKIKELGLKKTSSFYKEKAQAKKALEHQIKVYDASQTLQSKNMEGGN